MEYKASWDRLVKIMTAIFLPFIVVINYFIITLLPQQALQTTTGYIVYATVPLVILVVVISYLYAPQKYIVTDTGLVIVRLLKNRTIPFNTIKSIARADDKDFSWNLRVFGVGGLFGYFGIFRNPTLGNYKLYGTQRKNYILIVTNDDKKLVITPDDVSLVNEVKKRLG